MGFFDDYLAKTEPQEETFTVDFNAELRLTFKVDGGFAGHSEREATILKLVENFVTRDSEGKHTGYKGMHKTWRQPQGIQELYHAVAMSTDCVHGESLKDGEWVKVEVGLRDFLSLAGRGAAFAELLRRVSEGRVKHLTTTEEVAIEDAKKNCPETDCMQGTCASDCA